jgi:hypothetical protein
MQHKENIKRESLCFQQISFCFSLLEDDICADEKKNKSILLLCVELLCASFMFAIAFGYVFRSASCANALIQITSAYSFLWNTRVISSRRRFSFRYYFCPESSLFHFMFYILNYVAITILLCLLKTLCHFCTKWRWRKGWRNMWIFSENNKRKEKTTRCNQFVDAVPSIIFYFLRKSYCTL